MDSIHEAIGCNLPMEEAETQSPLLSLIDVHIVTSHLKLQTGSKRILMKILQSEFNLKFTQLKFLSTF